MGCSSLFTHVLSVLKSKVPCSLRITFFAIHPSCYYIRRYILLWGIEVTLVRGLKWQAKLLVVWCRMRDTVWLVLGCFWLFSPGGGKWGLVRLRSLVFTLVCRRSCPEERAFWLCSVSEITPNCMASCQSIVQPHESKDCHVYHCRSFPLCTGGFPIEKTMLLTHLQQSSA
jgi:hypothetical protein